MKTFLISLAGFLLSLGTIRMQGAESLPALSLVAQPYPWILISWSNNPCPVVLEVKDSLTTADDWKPVPQSPESYQNQYFLAFEKGGKDQFFRLRSTGPATSPLRLDIDQFEYSLAWPAEDPNFVLEMAEAIEDVIDWKLFPYPPRQQNSQFSVGINLRTAQFFYRLRGLPKDPVALASQLDPQYSTPFADATAFLHSGPQPLQTGVISGTIERLRAAVLRGQVKRSDGKPLAGVTISIQNHPEYGRTSSRSDGMFDLAVNGGGRLDIHYHASGYLDVQQPINVPWLDFLVVPDVILLPADSPGVSLILSNNPGVLVAQGRQSTDESGTRTPRIIIPAGTTAAVYNADGTTRAIHTVTPQFTEYTVGPEGPKKMPAPLPPTVAYTYCIELGTAEAQAKVAGKDMLFNQPVFFYLENFLGMPAGIQVPSAYYDPDQGVWVPSPDGRVIRLLGVNSSGLAEIDVNGGGAPANTEALAALGMTDAERRQLALSYSPNQSLWRVPMHHFSTYDCNYGVVPASGAITPNNSPVANGRLTINPSDTHQQWGFGSLQLENQVFQESFKIAGTAFSMHYASDRVPGFLAPSLVHIPLSGDNIPPVLKRIDLEIHLAGRKITQSFPPSANLSYDFQWDGLDCYHRTVTGYRPVTIRIGYAYDAFYALPSLVVSSFGLPSGTRIPGNIPARQEIIFWQEQQVHIIKYHAKELPVGGWTLSAHHKYDPQGRVLYLGDGRQRSAPSSRLNLALSTIAGGKGRGTAIGDGGPATNAFLAGAYTMIAAPDGSLLLAEEGGCRVRRMGPDGIITTVAGRTDSGSGHVGYNPGYSGDGGPATEAQLNEPHGLALAPDGRLYISDTENNCIRCVDRNGIIRTVAGLGGPNQGYGGDGGPAIQAQLNRPSGILVGLEGWLYFCDTYNYRIRRVSPDGIIQTVVGNGNFEVSGDEGPALAAGISSPQCLAMGSDGSLYFSDGHNVRIRRVGPDGIIHTIAGTGGWSDSGDGGPARLASLAISGDLTITPAGHIYVPTSNSRIRVIDPQGFIYTIAGTGAMGASKDGELASQAMLDRPQCFAPLPDKTICFSEASPLWGSSQIRVLSPLFPGLGIDDILIASEDGTEIYHFNPQGRHLRTLYALTGATCFEFGYDALGALTQVRDAQGNTMRLENDISGRPLAIISPYGRRTSLSYNGNGFLASISSPVGEMTQCAYGSGGLLTSVTGPKGTTYDITYDATGCVSGAADPAGGFSSLSLSSFTNGFSVKQTTAENRVHQYQVTMQPSEVRHQTCTYADGTRYEKHIDSTGSRTNWFADGTIETQVLAPDPRFGMQAPLAAQTVIATPAGLRQTNLHQRTVHFLQDTNPLSMVLTNRRISNGRVSESVFTASNRVIVSTSAAGRSNVSQLDAQGRMIWKQLGNLVPVSFEYHSNGFPKTTIAGSGTSARMTRFGYDDHGLLTSVTDALGNTERYVHNDSGRIMQALLRDGRKLGFSYDANGNLNEITPPDRSPNRLTYTPVDLVASDSAPAVGGITNISRYAYNADRQLTNILHPDRTETRFIYDNGGRIDRLITPDNQKDYEYHPTTGKLAALGQTSGANLAFQFDGEWLQTETWTGPIIGRVSRAYDNNLRIIANGVNDQPAISYQYDSDDYITNAAGLTLARDPANGLLISARWSNSVEQWSYNGFGEATHHSAAFQGTSLFQATQQRDALGRITNRTEVVADTTTTFNYEYDLTGRLTRVLSNGVLQAAYVYDSNGNRLSATGWRGSFTGQYDAQDRLISYGPAAYAFDANGRLTNKTVGNLSTSYHYDSLGGLKEVRLPNGDVISYVIDGAQRRIGRKINGNLAQGFLYLDCLRPIAELDGANQVVSVFVYGRQAVVPDCILRNGAVYRIIADAAGSPRIVFNADTGEIMQRMDYDEFGVVIRDTNPGFQPFGFAGGLYDPATGLVRRGMRDYDMETGRWTTKDPVPFGGGALNPYCYAGNEPVNRVDPFGLFYFATGPNGGGGYGLVLGISGQTEAGFVMGTTQEGKWKEGGYTSKSMSYNLGVGAGVGGGWSFTLSPLGNLEDYRGDSWTWSISGSWLIGADVTFSMPMDPNDLGSWSGFWHGAITVTPGAELGGHGWVGFGGSTTTLTGMTEMGEYDPTNPVPQIR